MKYRSQNRMITQPFLNRFIWKPVTQSLPKSLHPNHITIFGFISGLISAGATLLGNVTSPWWYLASSFFLFVYLAADNVDGQFASRTGKSSELGAFLDHFLDSVINIFVIVVVASAAGASGIFMIGVVFAVTLNFAVTLWEQMETSVWRMDAFGPNEGILALCVAYVLFAFFPGAAWLFYTPGTLNLTLVLGLLGILACIYQVVSVWRRSGNYIVPMAAPLTLSAVLIFVALAYPALEYQAAGGIAVGLQLFTSRHMVSLDAGIQSTWRRRGIFISAAVVAGLGFWLPLAPPWLLWLAVVIPGVWLTIWDLSRVVPALRGRTSPGEE